MSGLSAISRIFMPMEFPADAVIEAQHLSKHYYIYDRPHHRLLQMLWRGRRTYFKEFKALEDVSFEVYQGETVGVIGRNGAGKSTLLQLLCQTLSPTAGEVRVTGRVAALLELGAGFNPEFSGRDNVYLSASILGLTQDEITERFQKIADFADIGEYMEQPVKTYSSGMYVRLAFAVIAHVDADILIIDEALAVGDALFTQKCMRFLRHFREHGTLLFVSHDTASVTSLCERAIWLEHGRLRAIGAANDICKQYNAEIYHEGRQQHFDSLPGTPDGSLGVTPRPASGAENDAQSGLAPPEKPRIQAIESTPALVEDPRQATLAAVKGTPLNNAMTVQAFNPLESFGTGKMKIEGVWLEDEEGQPTASITGGEAVTLYIDMSSQIDVDSVIAGFQVKDRRGQILFGDNTCIATLEDPVPIAAGQRLRARFQFQMPLLPGGEYSITVSVAEGTQYDHVQHHWVHDALIMYSLCASVSTGIVGIPMFDIGFDAVDAQIDRNLPA